MGPATALKTRRLDTQCALVLAYQEMAAKDEGEGLDFETAREKILYVRSKIENTL